MAAVNDIPGILNAINKAVAAKVQGLSIGLKKSGLLLQRESMKLVPVDYGNLRASAFTRCEGENTKDVEVTVGYMAAYAIFVHEDLDAAHGSVFNAKYAAELAHSKALRKKRKGGTTGPFRHDRGPNQQAKFLEKPFRELRKDILAIVAAECKK